VSEDCNLQRRLPSQDTDLQRQELDVIIFKVPPCVILLLVVVVYRTVYARWPGHGCKGKVLQALLLVVVV